MTDSDQTDRGPLGGWGEGPVSIWCDLIENGRSYANFTFFGPENLHTLPRMKYSRPELRAQTCRVDSPYGGTTFVFWNHFLPTLTFRVIPGLVGLWREIFGSGWNFEMGITRFVFEISGWVSFHFEAEGKAHRVIPGLRGFCPF